MKKPVKMPALTDTMESGRLVQWNKEPGDEVEKGDIIAEVETDKAVTEMEAFHGGYLAGPLAEADAEYEVGETLAWITDQASADEIQQGEAQSTERQARARAETSSAEHEKERPQAQTESSRAEEARGNGTQERQAREEERSSRQEAQKPVSAAEQAGATSAVIDQALGSRAHPARGAAPAAGPDTRAAIERELKAGPRYEIAHEPRLRRLISETVMHSATTPQFRISTRVGLKPLSDLAGERQWSMTLMLAKACAVSIAEHPRFNAAWTPEGPARRQQVDVAIAMETEHGLLTPVLRDVSGQSMQALAGQWQSLKDRVQHRRASAEDYRGATFYLSNLGMFDEVVQFDALVPPGAAAILAVAAPDEQGTMLTLGCDHRIIFGADAARFLATLRQHLMHPGEWA